MECKHEGELILERVLSIPVKNVGGDLVQLVSKGVIEQVDPRLWCHDCGEELILEEVAKSIPAVSYNGYKVDGEAV